MPILNIIAGAASLGLQPSATLVTGVDNIPIWSSSMTDGQLLIGKTGSAPVVASLSAGTGISITPGAGTLSIAVTGGAAVTSVSATLPLLSSGGTTPAISMQGLTGLAQGDLIYGDTAANTFARLTKDANATRYLSNQGTNNNPSWNQVNLANGVTGVLLGANGGTGVANTGFTITLAGNLATSGANSLTLTTSGSTNVTLPTSGTLATTTQVNLRPLTTFFPQINGFRLTLTSGVPVTSAAVVGATTIYFTPYKGGTIALYNVGTALWELLNSAEVSIGVPATTNTMYDIFAYDSSGTLTLEAVAWSTGTARATAIVFQDGVYCKSGSLNKRYVGSFVTTGVSGQTQDQSASRYLWNYYNRVCKSLVRQTSTASWTYNSNTIQQAASNTSNQVDFVMGVSEDLVELKLYAGFSGGGNTAIVGIVLDSTTSLATGQIYQTLTALTSERSVILAAWNDYPGIGKHKLVWVEATDNGTCTFFGQYTIGALTSQYGMTGTIWC